MNEQRSPVEAELAGGAGAVLVIDEDRVSGLPRSLATFQRVSDAVASALMRAAEPGAAPCIAIHVGEDEHVAAVRATRLAAIGHSGQVLLSRAAADLVIDRLPAGTELLDIGIHRLRDLGRPEHVFQLCHPNLPAPFPPLRSLGALPNNLPPQLTAFIGRDAELVEVQHRLLGGGLLTLTGAGGCGKTRLAAHAAADVVDRYPGGVWWVELASIVEDDRVGRAVLAAVGVRHDHARDVIDRLAAYIADRPALIVLDNCEHVVDAAASFVDRVLHTTPAITFLATSREALSVPGEQVWRVPALSLPPEPEHTGTETLDMYDAVRLFVDRAGRARPGFTVTNQLAPVIAELCVRLDGIALAIELAAARVRLMSPEQILTGLDDRFRLLSGGARTTIPRQRTLEASVEWSHALLRENERVLLRRLSVLSSGFDLDAAIAVCGGDGLAPGDVVELLGQLVDKSLVALVDSGAQYRYRMLETIAQFAGDRLLEAGETASVRDRHLAYFLRMAETLTRQAEAGDIDTLNRLDGERLNFDAALEWGLAAGAESTALRLATMLAPFWIARSHYMVGHMWLTRILARAERDGWWARGAAALAWLHLPAMDIPSAFGLLDSQAASEVAATAGDEIAAVRALLHQAVVEMYLGSAEAPEKIEVAAARATAAGDTSTQVLAWAMLFFGMAVWRDDASLAGGYANEVADACRTFPDRNAEVLVSMGRGSFDLRSGRLDEARPHLESAVALSSAMGSIAWQMFAVDGLVELELLAGNPARARAAVVGGLDGIRGSAPGREEVFLSHLAAATLAEGDAVSAAAQLASIESAIREFAGVFVISWLIRSGSAAIALGDLVSARASFEEALVTARAQSQNWLAVRALHMLGRVARYAGELRGAEDYQHEALAIALEHRYRPLTIVTITSLASLALDGESPAEAARLFAAAETGRQAIRFAFDCDLERTVATDLRRVTEELGTELFGAASDEGRALTLEDAAAYARRARGERKRPSTGWLSLTPTEVQVVGLVTEGLSNPQIGARMFISLGTVKSHLAHVFAKVGVATRAELAAAATRRLQGVE